MKKLFTSACIIACLFMSIIANAEPKMFDDTVINADSCYVTTFYDIDSLVIKNNDKVKVVLVNDKNEVLFENRQKYIAVALPAGTYKVYAEKEIKTVYESNN